MSPRVSKRPQAERDIEELAYLIGQNSVAASDRFLLAGERALEMLGQSPELGSICGFRSPAVGGIRSWTIRRFKRYVIYYRCVPSGVEVVRVLHGAREAESLLEA